LFKELPVIYFSFFDFKAGVIVEPVDALTLLPNARFGLVLKLWGEMKT